MDIRIERSGDKKWNSNALTVSESGEIPEDCLLVCIHNEGDHHRQGETVIINRSELVRALRAVEAATEILHE